MLLGIDASRANHKERTGVEEYAYCVIQELKKIIPEDVRVILYTDKPLQGELANLPNNWQEKVLSWWPKRLWTQVRLSIEMLVNPPEVLFIPAHVFPLIHPQKTVMTVHDIAAVKFPQSYNWFEKWYTLWSSKFAVKKLWKVIVPSNFTKQELISNFSRQSMGSRISSGQFPISNNIEVIYHGYDKEKFKVQSLMLKVDEVLNKYKITRPFLMTIGRLEEKKNTVGIVKAFEKLKDNLKFKIQNLKLLLVGKPGHGYEKVKQAIEESVFNLDIVQPGWVAEEDLPYLLNTAEVFVFPSLYEGFGLTILEAMACGCPVVASRGNSLEEVGGESVVYVKTEDFDGLATAIENLITDEELRKENVSSGLARVEKFSWNKCGQKTWQVLKD